MTFERCCLNDPLPSNEAEFIARGKEAKNRLLLIAQELARLVGNVLDEYQHRPVRMCVPNWNG